ncbi:MAG: hypothetical protein A2413_02080 [Treponema sp. RIFOXYC1_FULL_61_9]|nr:MAG: hypothetical protein A2413_02080 [Treponema sp. RIFOXYC1_FULL_61_9]
MMLLSIEEAVRLIGKNEILHIAGSEDSLAKLPKGKWIGGTIPYFMTELGGLVAEEKVFVTGLSEYSGNVEIVTYDEGHLKNVLRDAPENGFTIIIIPAFSRCHISYAENAPNYEDMFMKPIIGWISGVHLDDLGKTTPKTFNGETGEKSGEKAIAMHVSLPPNKFAEIGIINILEPGQGDTLQFETEGFFVKDCLVNGLKTNFADYLVSNRIDAKLPLVANFSGSMVNVSIREINNPEKIVHLYAPVFLHTDYHIAQPVSDYVTEFMTRLSSEEIFPVFSCNCILNYLYSKLEGKKTGHLTGPMTFGEIAYQLLNQTLVYLEVKEVQG